MINRPYYYRHFLERRPLKENKVKEKNISNEIDQKANLDKENNITRHNESAQTSQVAAGPQLNKEETVKNKPTAELRGFEKVAPGVFQFKQNWQNPSPLIMWPQSKPAFHLKGPPELGTPELAESGFIRVDGIPGPYEHYQTPVYQFT